MQCHPAGVALTAAVPGVLMEGGRVLKSKIKTENEEETVVGKRARPPLEMVGRMNDVTYAKDPARRSISRGCLPTLPPVKSCLISLCLSCLIYKMGTQ